MQVDNPTDNIQPIDILKKPLDLRGLIDARKTERSAVQKRMSEQLDTTRQAVNAYGELPEDLALDQKSLDIRRRAGEQESSDINKSINDLNLRQMQDVEDLRAMRENLTREGYSGRGVVELRQQEQETRDIGNMIQKGVIEQRQRNLSQFDAVSQRLEEKLNMAIDQNFERQKQRLELEKDLLKNIQSTLSEYEKQDLDLQIKDIDRRYEELNKVTELKLELRKNGMSDAMFRKIEDAQTRDGLLSIQGIGTFMRSPLERMQEAKLSAEINRIRQENAQAQGFSKKDMSDATKSKQFQSGLSGVQLARGVSEYRNLYETFTKTPITNIAQRKSIIKEMETKKVELKALTSIAIEQGVIQASEEEQYDKKFPVPRIASIGVTNINRGANINALKSTERDILTRARLNFDVVDRTYGGGITDALVPEFEVYQANSKSDDDLAEEIASDTQQYKKGSIFGNGNR